MHLCILLINKTISARLSKKKIGLTVALLLSGSDRAGEKAPGERERGARKLVLLRRLNKCLQSEKSFFSCVYNDIFDRIFGVKADGFESSFFSGIDERRRRRLKINLLATLRSGDKVTKRFHVSSRCQSKLECLSQPDIYYQPWIKM